MKTSDLLSDIPVRKVLLALLVCITITLVMYLALKPTQPRLAPTVRTMAKDAQETAVAKLANREARRFYLRTDADCTDAYKDFHRAVPLDAKAMLDDEAIGDAFTTLTEFSTALGARSSAEYAAWAEGRDLTLRVEWPEQSGRTEETYRGIYESLTNEPAPPDLTPDEYFRTIFASRARSPKTEPVALLLGEDIIKIDALEFTHHADVFDYETDAYVNDGLGMEFWHGGSTGMGFRLWDPPRSLAEIINDSGAAPALRIRHVLECAGGDYLIFVTEMVYDPMRRNWHIHRIYQNNSKTVMPSPFPPPAY